MSRKREQNGPFFSYACNPNLFLERQTQFFILNLFTSIALLHLIFERLALPPTTPIYFAAPDQPPILPRNFKISRRPSLSYKRDGRVLCQRLTRKSPLLAGEEISLSLLVVDGPPPSGYLKSDASSHKFSLLFLLASPAHILFAPNIWSNKNRLKKEVCYYSKRGKLRRNFRLSHR